MLAACDFVVVLVVTLIGNVFCLYVVLCAVMLFAMVLFRLLFRRSVVIAFVFVKAGVTD